MNNDFLKQCLLDNNYGTYRLITETYREQMAILNKPALFRKWLAEELDIPLEKINLSSLNSALQLQRKKDAKTGLVRRDRNIDANEYVVKSGKATGFRFSQPNSGDEKKSRVTEI